MILVMLALVLGGAPALAADAPDTGWETTMDPQATRAITWTSVEQATLDRGEAVSRYWKDGDGRSRGLSAVVVNAPAPAVWHAIVDFDAYVQFMPYVTASYVTSWEEATDYTRILAGYQLTTLGVNTRYKLDNRWYPDQGLMIFDVRPEGSGPISAGDGFWRVSPWKTAGAVLLEYSVDMSMQWWVPSVLERKAASRLPTVVRLMKRQAERDPRASVPDRPPLR